MTPPPIPRRAVAVGDAGGMSTTTIHNGGPQPVTITDDGQQLEPGQTLQVQVTERVGRLIESGRVVTVKPTKTTKPTDTASGKE